MDKKKKIKEIVGLVSSCDALRQELDGLDEYKRTIDKVRKQYAEK